MHVRAQISVLSVHVTKGSLSVSDLLEFRNTLLELLHRHLELHLGVIVHLSFALKINRTISSLSYQISLARI